MATDRLPDLANRMPRAKTASWVQPARSAHRPWALLCVVCFVAAAGPFPARAQEALKRPEDLRRDAAIAEFTRKTKAANYPALFDQAAAEFKVPSDLLKAIAFAETRWEHLTWPPGETVSPENGMPRPYGIMSLWDNQYFGHSLLEAATLIGKQPEELKQDPLLNIRGAAAWLRKLYDANPKPADTSTEDIESWRYAVRKYCGIPEPDLNARHALEVYVFMSRGYHQYGIEWDARPVNLDPIRAETSRIVQEESARKAALTNATATPPLPQVSAEDNSRPAPKDSTNRPPSPAAAQPASKSVLLPAWSLLVLGTLLLLLLVAFFLRPRST